MEKKLIDPNRSLKQLERDIKNIKVETHEENRELYNKTMADERVKLEKEWHDNCPEIDYKRWLEERLIEMREHYYEVNKQRLELIVKIHERKKSDYVITSSEKCYKE